jgi:tRNA (cmo5U34)-methyltransferase
MNGRDRLYADPAQQAPEAFEFNEAVVRVFPDMISRSVPGYPLLLALIPIIARRAVQAHSQVYDLGCSLAAATLAARRAIQVDGVKMIAVDNAKAMVERAQHIVSLDNSSVPVEVIEGDVCALEVGNASLVMMAFTLQFIDPSERDALVARIYQGLLPGGVLLLAEKLRHDDEMTQAWLDSHHLDFKRAQGYSDLEIARKRQALDNVLRAETKAQHHARLEGAGFDTVIDVLQALNFSATVAIKR